MTNAVALMPHFLVECVKSAAGSTAAAGFGVPTTLVALESEERGRHIYT
jgi:hypothetical protein